MNDTIPRKTPPTGRIRFGFIVLILGYLIFVLGAEPYIFGLDRSPVTGFVQITVFLIGLGILCTGGYLALNAAWNGRQRSIVADIGIRLVATGYVIAVTAGLADVFGLGSHPFPNVPSFGFVQAIGVMLGEITIAIGFIIFIPYPARRKSNNSLTEETRYSG
jgi:hypothetical protein